MSQYLSVLYWLWIPESGNIERNRYRHSGADAEHPHCTEVVPDKPSEAAGINLCILTDGPKCIIFHHIAHIVHIVFWACTLCDLCALCGEGEMNLISKTAHIELTSSKSVHNMRIVSKQKKRNSLIVRKLRLECWVTRTRTLNNRTKICCVTITP